MEYRVKKTFYTTYLRIGCDKTNGIVQHNLIGTFTGNMVETITVLSNL